MTNLKHVAPPLPDEVEAKLKLIYEEIMWLAHRHPHGVTEGMAREWGMMRCDRLKGQLRRFTGLVSKEAAASAPVSELHHEHHFRIRKNISDLVSRHIEGAHDASEFVDAIVRLESVNIVTAEENGRLRHHEGDPIRANVELINWDALSDARRQEIWINKIRRKVANAADFRPASLGALYSKRSSRLVRMS